MLSNIYEGFSEKCLAEPKGEGRKAAENLSFLRAYCASVFSYISFY
jgi:hypothetical protein